MGQVRQLDSCCGCRLIGNLIHTESRYSQDGMRRMLVSTENRKLVYDTVRAHWRNTGTGISSDTLANRIRLDVRTIDACCEVMVESRALENIGVRIAHPMWKPV